jgi:hypothetical protein
MRCPTFLSPMPGGDPSPRPPAARRGPGRTDPAGAHLSRRRCRRGPINPNPPHIRGTGRALAC